VTSKLLKLVLCLGLWACLPANAEQVSVDVVGRSLNYNNAVLDGLKQAIAQVSGITLDAQTLASVSESLADTHKNGQQTEYSHLEQDVQSAIASQINGYVSGYRILSSNKDADGLYQVEMTVDIEKYKSPGAQNNRYGLAVVGLTASPGQCYGNKLSAGTIQQEATKALVSAFTKTRKFAVLDRDDKAVYDLEKALIQDESVAAEERVKLGRVKGTDYIVTAQIKRLQFGRM